MQNRLAAPAWSYLSERLPPTRIIEFGTHEGGFSVLLAILALNYKAEFVTYDINEPNPKWAQWFSRLSVNFTRGDIFTYHREAVISRIQSPGVTFLLCDNGCKLKELEAFAPYLKPGDVIGAHDYAKDAAVWCCSEVSDEAVAPCILANKLIRILPEVFEPAAWLVLQKQ